MIISEFIDNFNNKKIVNTKINEHAVSDYLREVLEIKTYIPFREKRAVVEMVVAQNITEEDGIKRSDSINQYVSFVTAMITLHTNLEFSEDPVTDYDLLAESGLLPQIIAEFKTSYDECDILLKMALTMELEDNNINVLVGKFLNGILQRIDGVGGLIKDKLGDLNLKDILGQDIKPEDIAKLQGLLDRWNK
jgi:hypothetical protein